MEITIRPDDPGRPEVVRLLNGHLDHSALHSPPGSMHALDVQSLRAPDITFWTGWEGSALLACVALKHLAPHHGEIKSMHTVETHRKRGVGALMLSHIVNEARRRSYDRLSLETGSMAAFAPARALYARFGFEICPPFAGYREDPHRTYMQLNLMT